MIVLGLNALNPDAAAALLIDGRVAAAVEEERLARVKHVGGFPSAAARACLEIAGVAARDVDHVAFARLPERNMTGPILFALSGRSSFAPELRAALEEAAQPVDARAELARALGVGEGDLRCEVHLVEHQLAHAAHAYYASPFTEAAVLSVDTVGDFCSTLLARGAPSGLEVLERVLFPHSLGIFYAMVAQLLGFDGLGDEGHVSALAARGGDRYLAEMRRVVRPAKRGGFELDLDWFLHGKDGEPVRPTGAAPRAPALYSARAVEAFGAPRHRDAPIGAREHDLAYAAQRVLEERLFDVALRLRRLSGEDLLAYGGHVALNAVATGYLRRSGIFRHVSLSSCPGDAGTAVGAAQAVSASLGATREALAAGARRADLGPEFGEERIADALRARALSSEAPADLPGRVAEAIDDGGIVGWFQGRMEFGPRALGRRSVLADPRRLDAAERLRRRLARRAPYRSFGASVTSEAAPRFFEAVEPSPYMLDAFTVRPEWAGRIPAVVHRDGTTRLHTVEPGANPGFHAVLEAFGARTGLPVLLNTSFNLDEPIVCTPEEAIATALRGGLDWLAIGARLVDLRAGASGRRDARDA